MEIKTLKEPAAAAGTHISQFLHALDGGGMCLLSGGSALGVIPYIRLNEQAKRRTIFMMVDERVSGEATKNNFLQLQSRYPGFVHEHYVIDTHAKLGESPKNFATRIEQEFLKIFTRQEQETISTIALLGIGTDGHTAGIFPMDEESFTETYPADSTYVPAQLESLTIDSSASFSPAWLLDHAKELIGYVTGESKKPMLESLKNESKAINEMPAQILKIHGHATVYTDQTLAEW